MDVDLSASSHAGNDPCDRSTGPKMTEAIRRGKGDVVASGVTVISVPTTYVGGQLMADEFEVLSEQHRKVTRILGEVVILTVKYLPVRAEHGLLPYYSIYQITRNGRLVDENDGPETGHASWDEAFAAIAEIARENIALDQEADGIE